MKNLSNKNQDENKIGQKQCLIADCGCPVPLLGITKMMT
jgi:hypothetical protein